MEMPEFAKEWVEALRSGEYKECSGRLNLLADNSFCTIGVACELAYRRGLVVKATTGKVGATYDGHARRMPDAVQKELGLNDMFVDHIVYRNDVDGLPFMYMADVIEQLYASL